MDPHADIYFTRGDISRNALAGSFTVDQEPGNTALKDDSVPDDLNPFPSNVQLSVVTDGGDVVNYEGQSPIHPFKSDQEPSDVQMAEHTIHQEHDHTQPQSNSDQDILPVVSKEVPPSDCAIVLAGEPTSLIKTNASEAHIIVHPQEPPLLRARTISPVATPGEERGVDLVDRSRLDQVHSDGLTRPTDEDETRGAFDYHCEDPPSPLPPSSSPPQLFSSSPYASSQSSASGIEPSEMMPAVEVEDCTGSQDDPHGDNVALIAQDESRLEFKNLHSHDIAGVATSPETDKYCLQMGPTARIEGGLAPSRKRIGHQNDPDGSYGPQPIKRPKLDSSLHLPPTPKRATLASQHRQFKKLAAPFRPPSKLPVVTDETQTMNNGEAQSTIGAMPEKSHDSMDTKESTMRLSPSQHKSPNTSRSATQFKSPLVNRDFPTDSRTIRLTPALQALERRLQLLKRAIKVKEEKEEEVLTRLAGKWIEAGREVAYDVWDATKDACNLEGKATFIRRSYGWESTNNEKIAWGWDTKSGEADEESCELDPSVAPCGAGGLASEEDDVGCNTLGTMLRQLGIAPEIFGWDDDKETFSD